MKYILATLLILITGMVAAADSAIPDSELGLGGISLGDTEAQVLSVLGPAQNRSETGEGTALEYPGLTVLIGWLEQQAPDKQRHVLHLISTGASACTPAGICPGTSVTKALATYGQPATAKRETGNFLEYYSRQSSCWLQLGTSDGTVRSISAVCQP